MKKLCMIALLMCLLTGCSDVATFETLGNIPQQPSQLGTPAQVLLELPEGAAEDVFSNEETLYSCQDYTICVQTLSAGNLSGTMKALSGYEREQLTVMQTVAGKADRYEWVWTSVGEDGDLVGRAAILDDGRFHYCLSVLAPACKSGELMEEWNELFSTFRLEIE